MMQLLLGYWFKSQSNKLVNKIRDTNWGDTDMGYIVIWAALLVVVGPSVAK